MKAWNKGLSPRLRSALKLAKIRGRNQAIDAVVDERLKPGVEQYGTAQHSELCKWLSISENCPYVAKSYAKYETDELRSSAKNTLRSLGIGSKEGTKQAILDGRLHPKAKGMRFGYGPKTHEQVRKWAGL